jgi:drug/metabolite transporter (DMT)-like permease
VLSAILYLGAGVGLTALRFATRDRRREAALRRDDAALVVGMTLAGGVLAPLLLLAGLRRVSAVTGSLLLNLEGALTVTLAVLFFGDHLGGRAAAGVGRCCSPPRCGPRRHGSAAALDRGYPVRCHRDRRDRPACARPP